MACNDLNTSINCLVLGQSLIHQVLVRYILVPPIETVIKWQIKVDVLLHRWSGILLIVQLHLLVSSLRTGPRCRVPSSLVTTETFSDKSYSDNWEHISDNICQAKKYFSSLTGNRTSPALA